MKRILILIVEDEKFLVEALKDNLESEGYAIDVAVDGDEALKKAKEVHPNLILLDLLLPKKDGIAVLEILKQDPELQKIPVIILSNFGGEDSIKRAMALGVADYLVKSQHPIGEVIDSIKKHLAGTQR